MKLSKDALEKIASNKLQKPIIYYSAQMDLWCCINAHPLMRDWRACPAINFCNQINEKAGK